MNLLTVLVGVAALLYGAYTFYARQGDPSKVKKLEPMKQQWGKNTGTAVHVIGYSVVPIIFGLVLIFAGFKGVSFF